MSVEVGNASLKADLLHDLDLFEVVHLTHSLLDFLERLRRGVGFREGTAECRLPLLHCFQRGVEEIENLLEFVELEVHGAGALNAGGKGFVPAYQGGDLGLNLADLKRLLQ